jgi:hypothetical protein
MEQVMTEKRTVYTVVEVPHFNQGMIEWCHDHIGHPRDHWFTHGGDRTLWSFLNPADATMFALRWS